MRIGVIGLGRIGAFHVATLAGLEAVERLVVADLDRDRAREVGERYGAEVVDSPEEVLGSGVDGVVIAAATAVHPDLLLAAVDAKVPAFCEKPVASTTEAGVDLARRVSGADVPVQLGFPRRFDAGFAAARAAVRSGELGWLHTVRATTLDPAPPPQGYLAASGGIFRDCAVHDFDAVRWVTGREVAEVFATGSNRGDPFFSEVGDVDTASSILTLDDGTLAVVSNTRYNPRGYDVRLEVHGAKDSIAVGLEDRLPLRSVEPGTSFPAGTPHDFFMDRFADAFQAELTAFVEVAAGGRESPCTLADALENELVAEACRLSWTGHRPVALEEVRRSHGWGSAGGAA